MFNKQEMYDIAMKELKKNKNIREEEVFEGKMKKWPELLYKIIVSFV